MKIKLKVLIPALSEAIGSRELDVEFAGQTVNDLIEHLIKQYGRRAKQALYDEKGELASVIQVLLDGKQWVPHDQLDTTLQDGTDVMFMILLGGG